MITKRQIQILVAIVEEYVKTNEPVGSVTLTKREDMNFSSATIRNDMATLEELGYLEKTHTSSGRVPSEKGYRLYVEEVMKRKHDEETYPIIDEIFNRPNITRSEAISESMNLVTDLTNYASIVLGKTAFNSRIKKIQFIDGTTIIESNVIDSFLQLEEIIIPNSVTRIGGSVFSDCTILTSVTIPNSVTEIGDRAFEACTNLTSITIPSRFKGQEERLKIPKNCKVTYK